MRQNAQMPIQQMLRAIYIQLIQHFTELQTRWLIKWCRQYRKWSNYKILKAILEGIHRLYFMLILWERFPKLDLFLLSRRDNDEKLELLLECNDIMLERINSNLDILSGIRKYPEQTMVESEMTTVPNVPRPSNVPISGSWNENRKILTAKSKTAK